MRILFLPKYDIDGASSRYRTHQYLSVFNIKYKVSSFFPYGYIGRMNKMKYKVAYAIYSIMRRIVIVASQSYKYDLIVIEKELIPYFPPILEYILHLCHKKFVLDFDDAIYINYVCHNFSLIRWLLGRKIPYIASWASGITTGSPELTSYLLSFNSNIIEIPTSIDLDKYKLYSPKPTNKYVIGWIGSRSTSKHLDTIAEVLLRFISYHKEAELHLIGYYGTAFRNAERVLLIPWNAKTEFHEMLQFHVGLMPLIDLPFEHGKCGFKLVQYMACAKPTISTPFPANVKIDGGNGNLFASTSEEWFISLETVCSKRFFYENVGRRNRLCVERNYSIQMNQNKYLEFFKLIVDLQ